MKNNIDRLEELICESTGVVYRGDVIVEDEIDINDDEVKRIAKRLDEKGVLAPPVFVGQKVYIIENRKVKELNVAGIGHYKDFQNFTAFESLSTGSYGCGATFDYNDIGEIVFFHKAEAEEKVRTQVTFEKWETRSSSTDLFYGIMNKDIGIVGTFGVSVYDEGLGVGSFEILEPYRNKGFGTAAIKQIVKMFSNDFDLIYCYVDSWNESAIRFYERLGKVHKNRLNESCQYYVELYKKEGGVR